MTLHEAVDLLECLLDQCQDHSIQAPDLIEFNERDEYAEALACVLNVCDGMLTR